MIKRDSYLNRMIHNMWNGEIKVITGIHRFFETLKISCFTAFFKGTQLVSPF